MKSLANPSDRADIIHRLDVIGPESARQWGRMTVLEMVCHCGDALRVSMGDRQTKPIGNWFSRAIVKPAALWYPRPWPHGFPTVPECDASRAGTQPVELSLHLRELRDCIDRFTRRPRAYALQAHPMFGPMTEKEWMRWGYLHLDHHLRQFGA
jgi:hypothetical protein